MAQLDDSLLIQASNSARTSFIILASFNALVGAATATGIYWDCYKKTRSEDPCLEFKPQFRPSTHTTLLPLDTNGPYGPVWRCLFSD
ncbi:hypothetical protein E4U55_000871 [Claviceps digitariae]|nr:hypothetical protein E4U55_000871 [Claviceps digitariae]